MISYSDSEVGTFHPICEDAINQALVNLGLNTTYRAVHHRMTGSLEMDYVIENITTGKYLCVVEVKRTPAAVNSTRYQFQAMSYVQSNVGITEKPFYILTNLECAYSYRYDASRPSAYQQVLEPGFEKIASFSVDDEIAVKNKMALYFESKIQDFVADIYTYQLSLAEFVVHMEPLISDDKKWKTHLAVLLYEYIRGSFTHLHRTDLRDIRLFGSNVQQICREGGRVDFKGIFDYTVTSYLPTLSVPNKELIDLYDLGDQNISGDSVADVLHRMVSSGHEHEGEVATDIELARLVAALAKVEAGTITSSDVVCDPAAGSGNLISSAIEIMGLLPTQLMANDINSKLLELLSLRLGLDFARTVGPRNAPVVTNKDVTSMGTTDFSDVKILLMNPPYVAGINCVARKRAFFNAIRRLSGSVAMTNSGQMPLEAVFLELITELVAPGTVISCVFPSNFLTARGDEAQITRELVLSKFGLRTIFTYPGDEIFENVTKSTCVLVGRAKTPANDINVISSYTKVPDIDIHQFESVVGGTFSTTFSMIMPGLQAVTIPVTTLRGDLDEGWRYLNQEKLEAMTFIDANFNHSASFELLENIRIPMKRGTAGNAGGSDLLFICDELYDKYSSRGLAVSAAMRNSKYDSFIVGGGDSKFLDATINPPIMVDDIINDYITIAASATGGKQQRKAKTLTEWRTIVTKESNKGFHANSVLVPRASRAVGSAYLAEQRVFVSTNFLVCTFANAQDAMLVATWMTTIFYQLMCEISSKNDEGMRKMEVADIKKTYIPDLSTISATTISRLNAIKSSIEFVDLHDPQIRDVDTIWAEELFGANASAMLDETQRLLTYLANIREPQ